jgi:hypothetical protein
MRSTNIVIFLILLNSMAAVVGAVVPGVAPAPGGGAEINGTTSDARDNLEPNRQGGGVASFIGGVISAFEFLGQIQSIVFLGPTMLENIGVPAVLTGAFKLVVTAIVAIDLAELLAQYSLS